MPERDDCPTSAELAEIVEGPEHDGRWQDLVAHLSRCRACYSVFQEVRRLRSSPDEDPGELKRDPER